MKLDLRKEAEQKVIDLVRIVETGDPLIVRVSAVHGIAVKRARANSEKCEKSL